jgi:ubiquinone/menaquinone biosynthesis C-methylase UbiE
MKNLGFDASISKFLTEINIANEDYKNILDVGCGTGVIGLSLAERYANSSILFTDINKNLLNQAKNNAEQKKIETKRLSFAISDITAPKKITLTNNNSAHLKDATFDIVATGAVIGYSHNQEQTIEDLLSLVKPNGYFINIEMNEDFFGRMVSKKYKYPIMPLSEIEKLIKLNGFELVSIPVTTFPAKLTRTCYIARKY